MAENMSTMFKEVDVRDKRNPNVVLVPKTSSGGSGGKLYKHLVQCRDTSQDSGVTFMYYSKEETPLTEYFNNTTLDTVNFPIGCIMILGRVGVTGTTLISITGYSIIEFITYYGSGTTYGLYGPDMPHQISQMTDTVTEV